MSEYDTMEQVTHKTAWLTLIPRDFPAEVFHVNLLRDGQRHFNSPVSPGDFDAMAAAYFDIGVNELTPEKVLSVRDGSKITTFNTDDLTGSQGRMIWTSLVFTGCLEFTELARIHGRTNRARDPRALKAWLPSLNGVIPNETLGRMFQSGFKRGVKIAGVGWSFIWIAPYIDPRDSLLLNGLRSRS